MLIGACLLPEQRLMDRKPRSQTQLLQEIKTKDLREEKKNPSSSDSDQCQTDHRLQHPWCSSVLFYIFINLGLSVSSPVPVAQAAA